MCRAAFAAGLNVLAFDDYVNAKLVPKIRAVVKQIDGTTSARVCRVSGSTSILRIQTAILISASPGQMLTFIEDLINANKGTHSHVNNHAGAGGPPNDRRQGKRCAKPFRELSIRWDGSVAGCCNMWRGEFKCGNVAADGLTKVWNGKAFGALRTALYHGRRDMIPECSGCDAKSHRVGLLPDKFGKESLPLPDKSVLANIKQAISGPPLTAPVLRPWEKTK
jgi:radical SAM protein with 4Fe4S-binding SPASM domain